MKCACGNDARLVRNGNADRLTYWFCDSCKDEPKTFAEVSPNEIVLDQDYSKVPSYMTEIKRTEELISQLSDLLVPPGSRL